MNDIVDISDRYRRPRQVSAKEINAVPHPGEFTVWEACGYYRMDANGCMQCPAREHDPDHGEVTRGCYALADELCRVVVAAMKREER